MSDRAVDVAIAKAILIGTPKAWDGSISQLDTEAKRNPFAPYYFAERYALEMAMEEVRRHRRSTQRIPDILKANMKTHRLFAFAAMLASVHDRLPAHAQKALAGRVRGGLNDDNGLTSLAYEFLIASDLMQKGADVEWHDLESGGFDFLVRRGGVEAEVECKTFSADVGRKVHRRRHYQLGGLVYKDISTALKSQGNLLIDVVVDGHLTGNVLDSVGAAIRSALTSGSNIAGPRPCSVTVHCMEATELPKGLNPPNIDQAVVLAHLGKKYNLKNPSLLLLSLPRSGIAIMATRSTKPDDVVPGMYEQLKRGSIQFTGTRPALLCAHFLDLSAAEILSFHDAQERGETLGPNLIATRLFSGSRRPYLHTVKFTAPGNLCEAEMTIGNIRRRHIGESGNSFVFVSRTHPLADDPAYAFLS